jgi:hypothetical protein
VTTRAGTGGIVFRSSVFSKLNTYATLGAAVVVVVAVALGPRGAPGVGAGYAAAAVAVAVLVLAALLFHRLTVTFDGREIVIRFTIIKKRIPIEKVLAAEPCEIKWWRFGGTGIRFSGQGWAWVAASGSGIRIETERGATIANCEHADRLGALVEEFKRAAAHRT